MKTRRQMRVPFNDKIDLLIVNHDSYALVYEIPRGKFADIKKLKPVGKLLPSGNMEKIQ